MLPALRRVACIWSKQYSFKPQVTLIPKVLFLSKSSPVAQPYVHLLTLSVPRCAFRIYQDIDRERQTMDIQHDPYQIDRTIKDVYQLGKD